MNTWPPPTPVKQKNPVYRLADWFQRYPHYGAGFVALVVLIVFWPFIGPLLDLFR